MNMQTVVIPDLFSFYDNGTVSFDRVLSTFDWKLKDESYVIIDFQKCMRANYQAISLLVLYCFYLAAHNVTVDFMLSNEGASLMWKKIGGKGVFSVLNNNRHNFRHHDTKPLIALRSNSYGDAISKVEKYTNKFGVEYEKTLRYILAELFYNALERGISMINSNGKAVNIPSIVQYNWFRNRNILNFIVADLGVGVKKHLEQTYNGFASDCEAILHSIKPKVSGTFGVSELYKNKNNAGMGLFLSSNIIRKLHSEMYIVSQGGCVHITPTDKTHRAISYPWPETLIFVSVRLDHTPVYIHENTLSELRSLAEDEIQIMESIEQETEYYLNVYNFFGKNAEIKSEAISHRDRYLLPAIDSGKRVRIDFAGVATSPHSFLNALLATPISALGINAYKKIKIVNASTDIRETIDYIFDENT